MSSARVRFPSVVIFTSSRAEMGFGRAEMGFGHAEMGFGSVESGFGGVEMGFGSEEGKNDHTRESIHRRST